MAAPQLGPAVPRQADGRPERMLPDPRKMVRGRKVLPQLPSVAPARLRHTAKPK
jgi:hypothetical protein